MMIGWLSDAVTGHGVAILEHRGFSMPDTDAIIIGHSCPVPRSPAAQLSGSIRPLWRSGACGSRLLPWPQPVLSPIESISWVSPRLQLTLKCSTESLRQLLPTNV